MLKEGTMNPEASENEKDPLIQKLDEEIDVALKVGGKSGEASVKMYAELRNRLEKGDPDARQEAERMFGFSDLDAGEKGVSLKAKRKLEEEIDHQN